MQALNDQTIEELLQQTKSGNSQSREELLSWAYATAGSYFLSKLNTENALFKEDVEELTSDFFLEFEQALPRMKFATRFSRYLLKRSLSRYLRRKKISRVREILRPGNELPEPIAITLDENVLRPWLNWTDDDFEQYQTVLHCLKKSDDLTKKIIAFRIKEPPEKFSCIADEIGIQETAVRMRVSRFYALVRKEFKKKRYKV